MIMEEEDNYDYIYHGTPLPELEDEIVQRKKAARELEVRDEKGRQRFHGAFTGGFSAGYFNTVGTKEGWAPSTFVSSRQKTADRIQQNPEDFMDDEDLGEFGIATRRIQTASKFDDPSFNKKKRKYSEIDSIIPGEAPLKDLVKPVIESIGIEILKKLGWKLGQGIGPRVKKDSGAKVYGCSPFPDHCIPQEDDPYSTSYTFAPKDTDVQMYSPKDDVFGLGYTGLSKESVLAAQFDTSNPTFTKSWLKKDKKKIAISGQAFGVGAFEDDDEDIYSKDDMSQYDFSELGANKKQILSKEDPKRLIGADGVLKGFCLASKPPPIKKYYPPPNLPPNFKPIRLSMPKMPVATEPQFASRHSMSAEGRSLLLGEKKFQSFQIGYDKKAPEKKTDAPDKVKTTVLPSKTKHVFRPFPNDSQKQQRYEEYLNLKETKEVENLVQPSSMTEWEKQQELEEFARAAVLFKPLSAALSSKFESKSHLSVEHEVMEAIVKAKKESDVSKTSKTTRKLVGLSKRTTIEWHPASLLCKRFNVPDPFPNSSEVSGSQKSKNLFDHISFENTESSISLPTTSETKTSSDNHDQPNYVADASFMQKTENSFEISDVRNTIQVPLSEVKKPSMDFFKDIFENSSSDEEDSSKADPPKESSTLTLIEQNQTETTKANTSTDPNSENITTVKETKRVGFGVFANLDLDALNQRTPAVKKDSDHTDVSLKELTGETIPESIAPKQTSTSLIEEKKTESDNCEMEVNSSLNTSNASDLYGPELPPNYSIPSSSTKLEVKKHSKHKSKHKHKHHKHKSKKKKKKHSSHKSSDESSFASDEDIPPTVILEKLKKLQKVMKSGS